MSERVTPKVYLETVAVPVNFKNLILAIAESPFVGPYPRIGRFKGLNEIIIPHFIGTATTEIVPDTTQLEYGQKVIVYTQGEDPQCPR